MTEKLVFMCGNCGTKLVTDRYGKQYLRRCETDTWYGKPTGAITADCFCGHTMTAYEDGADGAFADDIEKATNEFERVIETAYEAARAAAQEKKNHS